jgi:hypothetical protein
MHTKMIKVRTLQEQLSPERSSSKEKLNSAGSASLCLVVHQSHIHHTEMAIRRGTPQVFYTTTLEQIALLKILLLIAILG